LLSYRHIHNGIVSIHSAKVGKNLLTKQVHNGSLAKKEWCEPFLSTLSCKLGSGKTRRKENMKEESTPYRWCGLAQTNSRSFYVSIYQISTYRTELPARVHKIILLLHRSDFKRGLSPALSLFRHQI